MSFRRNRTFVVAWLTPLLVALVALALPASSEAAGTGSISGTVTAEGGGALSNVRVCAIEAEVELEGCDTTDGTGKYTIGELEDGNYKVAFVPAETANYVRQWYQGARGWETATPVTVSGGGAKSGIDAVLEKGAKISGVVTAAATGAPAPEVFVCAFTTDGESGNCEETDSAGRYTIIGLPGGQYEIEFFPEGNGQGLVYQTYSLGLVTLAPHGEANNVNQALQVGGQIEGVVRLAATGAPLAGVRVCLTWATEIEAFVCLTSPASGAFRFYGLPTGSYKLAFSPAANEIPDEGTIVDPYPTVWWQGAASFATATPIGITPPAIVRGTYGLLGPPAAVAPIIPPTALPVTPPAKKAPPKVRRLKCHKGFVKRKVHGKPKCVRLHKAAKPKHRHHKKTA